MTKSKYLSILFVLGASIATISAVPDDYHPKEDCKRHDSLCFNGPKFDQYNQYQTCAQQGTIALTFDNAPSVYTNNILDVLKSNNIKATFFLKGANILAFPSVAQRIIDEGHQVGSSTFDLPILTEISSDKFEENLLIYEQAYSMLVTKKNAKKYFRAPRGFVTDDISPVISKYGYTPIQWTFRIGDVVASSVSDVVTTLSNHVTGADSRKMSIIVQMDAENPITGNNLGTILSFLSNGPGKSGGRFVVIDDCVNQNQNGHRKLLTM